MSIERIDPGRRFAQAVIHGDTVYLAGHTSSHPDAGVYEQTREILAAIDAHLATAGPTSRSCCRRPSGSRTSRRSTR